MEEGKLKDQTSIDVLKILGDYRELKDRLGCDPMKVVKALTEGCWIRDGFSGVCYLDGEPQFIKPSNLLIGLNYYFERDSKNDWDSEKRYEDCLCIFNMYYEDIDQIARLSDYGKTWALTKEELL